MRGNILGIDPGTTMGWCVLRPGETHRERYYMSGVHDTSLCKLPRYKVRTHTDFLQGLIVECTISEIWIETVLGLRGGDAKIALGQYIGSLLLCVGDIPVYGIHSSHWRKIVLGNGRANKAMAVAHVEARYGIVAGEDQSEAICITEAGQLCEDVTRVKQY